MQMDYILQVTEKLEASNSFIAQFGTKLIIQMRKKLLSDLFNGPLNYIDWRSLISHIEYSDITS